MEKTNVKKEDGLMENLNNLYKDESKKPSQNSLTVYARRLRWIKNMLQEKSSNIKNIIGNPNEVIPIIEDSNLSTSTKKLTYVLCGVMAKRCNLQKDIIEKYKNKEDEYVLKSNKEKQDNKVSDDRTESWTTWDNITSFYDDMPESTFSEVQDKLIIALYTKLDDWVLRLDFSGMVFLPKKDKNEKRNYIVFNDKDGYPGNYTIYLNDYKTINKYGPIKFKIIDKEVVRLLNKWFAVHNRAGEYLLVSYKDHNLPLSETALSKKIPIIFEEYIGKRVTNQILRQIKESDNIFGNKEKYDALSLFDKINLHKKLLHSFETGHQYAKKPLIEK
jgi:hypothetical protein